MFCFTLNVLQNGRTEIRIILSKTLLQLQETAIFIDIISPKMLFGNITVHWSMLLLSEVLLSMTCPTIQKITVNFVLWFLQILEGKSDKTDDSTSSDNSPVHCEALAQPGQRAVGSPEYMKNNRSFKKLWGK